MTADVDSMSARELIQHAISVMADTGEAYKIRVSVADGTWALLAVVPVDGELAPAQEVH